MFTIWGARQKFCDGLTRRNFLQIGAFGAGLTLADMLRGRAFANPAARANRTNHPPCQRRGAVSIDRSSRRRLKFPKRVSRGAEGDPDVRLRLCS